MQTSRRDDAVEAVGGLRCWANPATFAAIPSQGSCSIERGHPGSHEMQGLVRKCGVLVLVGVHVQLGERTALTSGQGRQR